MQQNSYEGLPDWQLAIIHEFPQLYLNPSPNFIKRYQELERPLPAKFCSLRIGFECGRGWEGLIRKFSQTADSLVKELSAFGVQPDAWVSPFSIREKLGFLVIATEVNLKCPFRKLLRAYEWRLHLDSAHVCEVTGEHGKLREVSGWFAVLSEEEYHRALKEGLRGKV